MRSKLFITTTALLAGVAFASAQAGKWLLPDALTVVEEAADAGFAFQHAGHQDSRQSRYPAELAARH